MMWRTYLRPATLAEALDLLDAHVSQARLIAGGTDVLVELSRGVRPTETLIDLTAIPDLRYVRADGDHITLGALATHNDVIASARCRERALPLAQACWEVGAPQIRTRATVAGNLITASPANDTITPLIALGASVMLASRAGERTVPLDSVLPGRAPHRHGAERAAARDSRPACCATNQRGIFLKLGLRRAQAISVINAACVLTFDGEMITDARITLGSVAPTIVRASAAEDYLRGKRLDDETRAEAGRLAAEAATPIDDVRGTAIYRSQTLGGLVAEALRRIAAGTEAEGLPDAPVLLDTNHARCSPRLRPLHRRHRDDHQRRAGHVGEREPQNAAQRAARGRRADRHQGGLRRGRVRRLHGLARRRRR